MSTRICRLCFKVTEKSFVYCETCRTTCIRCRKNPRAHDESVYCKECNNAYRRALRASTHNAVAQKRDSYRGKINRQIRAGLIAREPCQKCGDPNSLLFIPDPTVQAYFFLCLKHHSEAGDRYGLEARKRKEERELRIKARELFASSEGKPGVRPTNE